MVKKHWYFNFDQKIQGAIVYRQLIQEKILLDESFLFSTFIQSFIFLLLFAISLGLPQPLNFHIPGVCNSLLRSYV